jgi:hypothetical protein
MWRGKGNDFPGCTLSPFQGCHLKHPSAFLKVRYCQVFLECDCPGELLNNPYVPWESGRLAREN